MQLNYLQRGAATAARTRIYLRKHGRTPRGHLLWSPAEDEIIRVQYPDLSKLQKLLPARSYYAIRHRAKVLGIARKKALWTNREVIRLRKYYPTASHAELRSLFPGFKMERIRHKARDLKLRRVQAFKPTGFQLIDQIRQRCKDLNYSMLDLDKLARTKKYFQKAQWASSHAINGDCARRAIEALDGRLLAEWNEGPESRRLLSQ